MLLAVLAVSIYDFVYRRTSRVAAGLGSGIVAGAVLLSSVLSLQDTVAYAWYTSGRTAIARGDTESGLRWLERSVSGNLRVVPAYDAFGRLFLQRIAEPGIADTIAARTAGIPDTRVLTPLRLAVVSVSGDSLDRVEARGQLKQIHGELPAESNERWALDRTLGSAYTNIARGRVRQGNLPQAAVAYELSLRHEVDRVRIHKEAALVLTQLGRTRAAINGMNEAVDLAPLDWESYYLRGTLNAQNADLPSAMADYRLALRLNATQPEVLRAAGEACVRMHDPHQAWSYLSRARQVGPLNAAVLLRLADEFAQRSQVAMAEEVCHQILSGDAGSVPQEMLEAVADRADLWGRPALAERAQAEMRAD